MASVVKKTRLYCERDEKKRQKFLAEIEAIDPEDLVVLDNAAFHKSKKTIDLIESAGCRAIFQPPYSPDLNKIEPMWANIKQRLRSYYDDSKTFYENLDYHFKDMPKCKTI